jgi:hypothetical protein
MNDEGLRIHKLEYSCIDVRDFLIWMSAKHNCGSQHLRVQFYLDVTLCRTVLNFNYWASLTE